MSRIVRASWSPPCANLLHPRINFGSYGALGHQHPELPDYVWVQWLDEGFAPSTWSGDRPAEGYYWRVYLRPIGTAFIQ